MTSSPETLIAAFYKFVDVADVSGLAASLQSAADQAALRGSILVAPEGMNGTIAGEPGALRGFLTGLRADPRFTDLAWKESWSSARPFRRMKVRLKREIVSMGAPGVVSAESVGAYVAPEDWNAVIADPSVAVVDVRNDYEIALGQFDRAIDPATRSFRDFPDWARTTPALAGKETVAMYCTGGIRCEKATAYLRSIGFKNVLHLEGGILKYLETVSPAESLWRGECFVFDDRVSVDHALNRGSYDLCHGCRMPISAADKASPLYTPGVACPRCAEETSTTKRARRAERQKQVQLAKRRGAVHLAGLG